MPSVRNNETNLTGTLEIARRDLLDLGLRNTLLNYRPLRSRGVEVVDEKPTEVFRILVKEEKSMSFLSGDPGGPTAAGVAADPVAQLAQPGDDPNGAARHKDSRLQTEYTSAQLQTRLLATYHAARTSMEEQGVNTLFLALGMLCWKEEDTSDKVCRAPLVLIPVQLERSDARARFHLKYSGEELGENISLAEKLKQDFGIRSFPQLPESDDLELEEYFRQVQGAVQSRSGWIVETDTIALGFFSFAKFLMYRDLDPATWPAASAVLGHPVLQPLLADSGFQPCTSNYREDCLLDDQVRNRDVPHVMDSDSSQSIAILDSLDGHSMVIQGPPGTGKSQTIVNLIAGAIAQGKRVLFVSEKMAALDVVKRRLDHARLGAACLELHSNRTNKKSIIEELRITTLDERQGTPQTRTLLTLLTDARDRLNAYCQAVNEPLGSSGENPCTAYGKLLEAQSDLKGLDLPDVQLDGVVDWTAEEIARRTQLVAQLQDRLTRTGLPLQHPFWGSQLQVLLPTDRDDIRKLVTDVAARCTGLETAAQSLAEVFRVTAPDTERGVATLCQTARHVLAAPDLAGVSLSSPQWLAREPQIRQCLASGRRHRELHRQYQAALRPEAWEADTAELRRTIAELGDRWWRFLSPRWRHAKQSMAALCTAGLPRGQAAQLALLDAIAEAAQCAALVAAAGEFMPGLLAAPWNATSAIQSDWDLLAKQADWVIAAQNGVHLEKLAAWCLDPTHITVDRSVASARAGESELARDAYQQVLRRWADRLLIEEAAFSEGPLASQTFSTLASRWTAQRARVQELHSLVAFNQISSECQREGLSGLASLVARWEPATSHLLPLYQRVRLSALLDRAFRERPALATFDGIRHSHTVEDFRRLDVLQLEQNRALLAAKHAQSLPTSGGAGEIGVLWREFEKRARFLPIRSLMLKAGHAIQSIKPVFMMSPLSIANYLPPGALTFDLVIFDEASQVRPVDALGAIARGQQVVVVGDSRQMPPTSFFDSLVAADAGDEAEAEDETVATSDIESVLGLFCSRGAHQRMLRWHYRSRHESLIMVSNHLFYQDRLVVFPSPDRERKQLGLVYRRVENAHYERSRTRTNPVEAKTVAEAVMAHAAAQLQLPREQRDTLGVAAFSVAQMESILYQLELLRREDASCEEFFAYPPHEPFFVKNLENVQGDERDVIYISVGYGRTAEGYLAMSFGPLNRTGGERRLNVLITRARKRCEVFTTLCADDLDLGRTSSAGVAALKTFLKYAESGQMDLPAETGKPPDSEFEEQVLRQLTGLGHRVHTQVGSAGFFLDLAVMDPDRPGRYLLGIECDGARYHSARSARDRDRLRQSVLEGLGWRIHRIWSTDWFHNPDQELRKVVQAIETARSAGPPSPPPAVEPKAATAPLPPTPVQQRVASSSVPYKCAQLTLQLGEVEMHMVNRGQLADLLSKVVSVESPVHWTEAARRVLNGAGIQRFGSRIQQAFEEAVGVGVSRGLFQQRQEFLWAPAMQQPSIRDRSELPAVSRKLELVCPEEIRGAILVVVKESYGIGPSEVPSAVCRLLGFSRTTDDMSAAVEPQCDALLREGRLVLQGVSLVTTSL